MASNSRCAPLPMRSRAIVRGAQATGIGEVTADAEVLRPIADRVAAVLDVVNFAPDLLEEVVVDVLRRESADATEEADKVRGEVISAAAMEIVGVTGIATVLRARNRRRKSPD